MRCIAKAAAIAKGIINQDAPVKTIRKVFKEKDIVSPPEWFQAMLAPAVLLLNASLTSCSDIFTAQHTNFWKAVLKVIVKEILKAKREKFLKSSPKRKMGGVNCGLIFTPTRNRIQPSFADAAMSSGLSSPPAISILA
eukprot:15179217-Ditylum_brightwellii.AAC.1